MSLVIFLQIICIVLVVVEYTAQIAKTLKRKTVEDLSFTYWIVKLTISALQILILFISVTPFNAYISQVLSLILCLIVFSLMIYFHYFYKK